MSRYKVTRPLHIGLSGAGGTGKGTFGNLFTTKYYLNTGVDLCFIESPIQSTVTNIFPEVLNYKDLSEEEHKIAQYSCLFAENGLEDNAHKLGMSYMAERSIFDIMAYTRRFFSPSDYDTFVHTAERLMASRPYDHIFYFPIEFEPKDVVEHKWKERNGQDRIFTDQIIRDLLYGYMPKDCVHKLTGSVEDRVAQALNVLIS